MPTCPECAQLLAAEAKRCPSCGHDLHSRPLSERVPSDRDEEAENDELLAAIASEGAVTPPPPWVPPLEERLRPASTDAPAPPRTDEGDVLPAPEKKSFFRRRR